MAAPHAQKESGGILPLHRWLGTVSLGACPKYVPASHGGLALEPGLRAQTLPLWFLAYSGLQHVLSVLCPGRGESTPEN